MSKKGQEVHKFCRVDQPRKSLEDLPDDKFIHCQVVAKDGKVWMMWGEFAPRVDGDIAVLSFRHDELGTLPDEEHIKKGSHDKEAMFQLDDDNDFRQHFADQVQRAQKELSKYAEQKFQEFLEDAVRNKANPPIEGEITKEKFDSNRIKLIHEQGTGRKWVEQNGTCISEVFDEREFYKL